MVPRRALDRSIAPLRFSARSADVAEVRARVEIDPHPPGRLDQLGLRRASTSALDCLKPSRRESFKGRSHKIRFGWGDSGVKTVYRRRWKGRPVEAKVTTGETLVTPENLKQAEVAWPASSTQPRVRGPGRPGRVRPRRPKKWRVIVIPKGTTHEFWQSVHAGAVQSEQRKSGEVEMIWQGACPRGRPDRADQARPGGGGLGGRWDRAGPARCQGARRTGGAGNREGDQGGDHRLGRWSRPRFQQLRGDRQLSRRGPRGAAVGRATWWVGAGSCS